jgi:hypothetical protein
MDAGEFVFQVHGSFETRNRFKAGLADGKVNHFMIHGQLQAYPLCVENLAAIRTAGILDQWLFAEFKFHHLGFLL